MRSLALAVALGAMLPLIHAYCWMKEPIGDMKQCLYDKDGTWHAIGSSWRTSDCMDCGCNDNGAMDCCTAFGIPTNIPDDCMKEFDQKACKFNVFKKNDRSIPCHALGYSGK
uniref:Beta-microseminoprotein n=1 Tax=Esox lucius TaxID=8010 RepID=A0AAY5KIH5_ESOLU